MHRKLGLILLRCPLAHQSLHDELQPILLFDAPPQIWNAGDILLVCLLAKVGHPMIPVVAELLLFIWIHTHTQPFAALLEYVRDHPGEQVPER